MASIHPDFEYDIFISYRHNDNRTGWVTDFVKSLREEIATTIKEPISIYFDSNSYDGLLETHHVDKTLELKLNSLVFIPIISQTYCDTKSFAWGQEFCVFNRLSQVDQFGREVTLSNGNVASRILPIKIHNIDGEDLSTIETEIDGVLRAIEFIYKEPGVNRPLIAADNKNDNQYKTDYRNQVNKLANAVKEIIYSITKPLSTTSNAIASTIQPDITESRPSIAVLPFTNMSQADQEYFADGITENIISELAANKSLKIISRTSVMRYKKTTKSAPEIAAELDVKYILEGGVQVHGKKVRINVQLVEAEKDDLTWSKIFVEAVDDIFEIQSHVAEIVAKELQASIGNGKTEVAEVPTKNSEAYNLFLKGRHAFNQWGVEGYRIATEFYQKALELDPDFKQAYSGLASSYSARMSWNGDLSPQAAQPYIEKFLAEAWKRGPSSNDFHTRAFVDFFINKDFPVAEVALVKAIELSPSDASAMYTYSYLLNMMGRFNEAQQWVNKAKTIDPLTVTYFNFQILCSYFNCRYEEALQITREALQLYPSVLRLYDFLARIYLTIENWNGANEAVQNGFRLSKLRPPSMVAFQAIALNGLGKVEKCKELLNELIQRSEEKEKGVNIYLAYVHHALGENKAALDWTSKARKTNDVDLIWVGVDPLLAGIRDAIIESAKHKDPDFYAAEKHITKILESEMPNLPYHNIDHVKDVLASALVIAEKEEVTPDELKIIRLAVLLHDIGFIRSVKDSSLTHEVHGVAMAKEILPDFGFPEDLIKVIENIILATRLPQSPSTQLEKIVCDADLDYLGREDFYETGQKLFKELLEQGAVETEREWNLVQRTFLQSHHYHTQYSQSTREPRKQERLKEIMANLKNKG